MKPAKKARLKNGAVLMLRRGPVGIAEEASHS
jgi:hypothetical protein